MVPLSTTWRYKSQQYWCQRNISQYIQYFLKYYIILWLSLTATWNIPVIKWSLWLYCSHCHRLGDFLFKEISSIAGDRSDNVGENFCNKISFNLNPTDLGGGWKKRWTYHLGTGVGEDNHPSKSLLATLKVKFGGDCVLSCGKRFQDLIEVSMLSRNPSEKHPWVFWYDNTCISRWCILGR